MASTNSTTHYDLSQYIATDKPTYLVDYNGDMSKIDAGLHEADSDAKTALSEIGDLTTLTTTTKTSVVGAINEVDTEASKIGNLSNLTTTANTDLVSAINEVDAEADTNTSAIGTLANLDTTVKTNLVGAINEVNTGVKDVYNTYNLVDFDSIGTADVTTAGGITVSNCDLTVATNSDGSVFKLYGQVVIDPGTATDGSLSFASAIRPTSALTISYSGIVLFLDSNLGYVFLSPSSFNVAVDGTVTITGLNKSFTAVSQLRVILYTSLFYAKDFGDTPVNN